MPEDWERGVGNSGGGWLSSTWDSKPPRAAGSNDPNALWDFEGYAIMMNINNAPDDGSALTPLIQHVFPCDNSHSVIVNVEDPHHISLNNIAFFAGYKENFGTFSGTNNPPYTLNPSKRI